MNMKNGQLLNRFTIVILGVFQKSSTEDCAFLVPHIVIFRCNIAYVMKTAARIYQYFWPEVK
jgi:hypothetical protein